MVACQGMQDYNQNRNGTGGIMILSRVENLGNFLENFGVFKLKIEKKVVSSQRNY